VPRTGIVTATNRRDVRKVAPPMSADPVPHNFLRRLDVAEETLCRWLNGLSNVAAIRCVFWLVSRLGDGVFWYVLMLILPVAYGRTGLLASLQMAATGAAGVMLYRWMKGRFVRERPHVSFASIRAAARPLDQYSFPSGHTLHAVSFSLICLHYFPELGTLLIPFALLVALSRPVLGLHYPTDVLAGGAVGWGLATAGFALIGAVASLMPAA
jgi:undecaprenyl-diphosphatase